eukprot:96269-Prymnesium_polylepis.2
MPPAARRARESAPDARWTSAPGRGAVRKTYTANLALTAPSSRYRREGPNKNGVNAGEVLGCDMCVFSRVWFTTGDLATGTGDLATCWRPVVA